MKETTSTLVIIIVLIIVAAGAWWYFSNQQEEPANVTITDEFQGKVVYTTDTSQDAAPFEADCRERGGTFNSCGTICEPGAEVCAQVCALTCEWSTEVETPLGSPSTWQTYADPDLGFAINRPSEMRVGETTEGGEVTGVLFMLAPQATDTEESGASVAVEVTKSTFTQESLGSFAAAHAADVEGDATATEPTPTTSNGREGYTYTVSDGIESRTYVILSTGENTALVISYRVVDPENEGYQSVVDGMLSTLEVFTKL